MAKKASTGVSSGVATPDREPFRPLHQQQLESTTVRNDNGNIHKNDSQEMMDFLEQLKQGYDLERRDDESYQLQDFLTQASQWYDSQPTFEEDIPDSSDVKPDNEKHLKSNIILLPMNSFEIENEVIQRKRISPKVLVSISSDEGSDIEVQIQELGQEHDTENVPKSVSPSTFNALYSPKDYIYFSSDSDEVESTAASKSPYNSQPNRERTSTTRIKWITSYSDDDSDIDDRFRLLTKNPSDNFESESELEPSLCFNTHANSMSQGLNSNLQNNKQCNKDLMRLLSNPTDAIDYSKPTSNFNVLLREDSFIAVSNLQIQSSGKGPLDSCRNSRAVCKAVDESLPRNSVWAKQKSSMETVMVPDIHSEYFGGKSRYPPKKNDPTLESVGDLCVLDVSGIVEDIIADVQQAVEDRDGFPDSFDDSHLLSIPKLVAVDLWSDNKEIVKEALRAMSEHCSTMENRQEILEAGGHLATVVAMKRWSSSPDIIVEACNTLEKGSRFTNFFALASVRIGALEVILHFMEKYVSIESVQAYGCSALCALAWSRPTAEIFVFRLNGIDALYTAMLSFPFCTLLQQNACWFFNHICTWEEFRGPAVEAGVLGALSRLIQMYTSDAVDERIIQLNAREAVQRMVSR